MPTRPITPAGDDDELKRLLAKFNEVGEKLTDNLDANTRALRDLQAELGRQDR